MSIHLKFVWRWNNISWDKCDICLQPMSPWFCGHSLCSFFPNTRLCTHMKIYIILSLNRCSLPSRSFCVCPAFIIIYHSVNCTFYKQWFHVFMISLMKRCCSFRPNTHSPGTLLKTYPLNDEFSLTSEIWSLTSFLASAHFF